MQQQSVVSAQWLSLLISRSRDRGDAYVSARMFDVQPHMCRLLFFAWGLGSAKPAKRIFRSAPPARRTKSCQNQRIRRVAFLDGRWDDSQSGRSVARNRRVFRRRTAEAANRRGGVRQSSSPGGGADSAESRDVMLWKMSLWRGAMIAATKTTALNIAR